MPISNVYRGILSGVSLLGLASPVAAQEMASREQAYEAGEIIVQARRRGEDLQDVPLTIQAVSGQELAKLEIRQFEDITNVVPGLELAANTQGTGTTASLRGVNFDANASGAATTVEFYRNDAVISSGALFQALYDIGQIEVLRGPQGTLRGRASPSGSITVTTRRPDLLEAGGYMSGSLSDEHRWHVNGAINLPVVAGKLGVRVAGFAGRDRGNGIFGLNLGTGEIDRDIWDRTEAIRASVRADPFDGILLLDFNYEGIHHANRQYDQVQSFNLLESSANQSPIEIASRDRLGIGALARGTDQVFKIYNWQAQLNLFGQKLTYVGSRGTANVTSLVPQDFAGLFAVAEAGGLPFLQDSENHPRQVSHEIRLQNDQRVLGIFDYVVGGMEVKGSSPTLVFGNTGIATATGQAAPYGTLINVVHTGRLRYREDKERSLFGNLTLHIGSRTEISGGIRNIWFQADSGMLVDSLGAGRGSDPLTEWVDNPSIRRCFGHSSVAGCLPKKKATIYSANIKHDLTDDLMVYASYGSSWRPGNSVVGYRGVEPPSELQDRFLNLPDETSKSYEAGIKSTWLGGRIRFNISGYYQKYSNYAYRVATPIISLDSLSPPTLAPGFNFVAPAPAKVKGIEADLAVDISDNLRVGGTFSFADGKIRNAVFPCVDLNDDNVPDTVAPTAEALLANVGANKIDTCIGNASPSSSSRFSGTVQAEYFRLITENSEGFVRGLLIWKGNSAGDGLNQYDSVNAYGLLNIWTGLRSSGDDWEIALFAKNLLNTNRVLMRGDSPLVTNLRAAGPGTISSTGATNYVPIETNAPQEFGINFRLSFGSR